MGWLVGGGQELQSGGLNNMLSIYTSNGPQLSPIVALNVTKGSYNITS